VRELSLKKIFDFKGKVSVELEDMELPNGRRMEVFRINFKPHTVSVLPITSNGTVWLLEQYRPAVKKWILEAPAGTGIPDEDPEATALIELEEETGLREPERLERVAEGYVSPGYTTEYMYYFIAWNPKEGVPHPEEHEVIKVKKFNINDAINMIAKGEIIDAKTILLILSAFLKLKSAKV
jgi:ADP-ribose pyrophosphatase